MEDEPASLKSEKLRQITTSAYLRLLAMHQVEIEAARAMLRKDSYPDFFVETSTQNFNEFIGDPTSSVEQEKLISAKRMAYIDQLRAQGLDDGYADYFVDSPGVPDGGFHERFGDSGPDGGPPPINIPLPQRVAALNKLTVIQAFLRLKEAE